ncbi:MAG TPA: class F sortase [Ornithinimicrobium sp.]|nr:class F sortase [Ornithinimicrobium sp.]
MQEQRLPGPGPEEDRGPSPAAAARPVGSTPTEAAAEVETGPPSTISVRDIGVESVLQPLGLNADGSLEVPAVGPRYDQAGWFTGSPRPGEVGPAVVLGHVNGAGGAPSVFARLAELGTGQRVTVGRDDGSQAHFEVYRVEQYPKDSFPTAAVYGDTSGPELRLITCAGTWDPGTGHYRDNTVVYARLVIEG